jgi:methylase of polypeptide subunit release factors
MPGRSSLRGYTLSFPFVVALLVVTLAGPALARELDVPYVPTPQAVVDEMLEMAETKRGDKLIDLGSGDGRIAITAAKKYGVEAVGIDLDPARIAEAKENALREKVTDKVTFQQQDLFETDLSKADVITLYLLNSINMKLRPKLMQLKPGTRIVSHSFGMGDWEPDNTKQVEGRTIYMWIIRDGDNRRASADPSSN